MNKIFTFLSSHIVFILLFVLGIATSWMAYDWWNSKKENERLHTDLIGQREEFEKLNDYVAQLESKYVDKKTIEKKQKESFPEYSVPKNERVKSISNAKFSNKGKQRNYSKDDYSSSDRTYNDINLDGDNSPPVGWILRDNKGHIESGTYDFDIEVEQMQTLDEKTGRVKVISKAYFVTKDGKYKSYSPGYLKWRDQRYPLKINEGSALIDPTFDNPNGPKHFYLWAPKFGIGLNGSFDLRGPQVKPTLNFSFSGYGRSKNDLDLRFLEVGVGLSKDPSNIDVHVKPVMWRPFKTLHNTYIGPGIMYSPKGGIGATMGMTVTF